MRALTTSTRQGSSFLNAHTSRPSSVPFVERPRFGTGKAVEDVDAELFACAMHYHFGDAIVATEIKSTLVRLILFQAVLVIIQGASLLRFCCARDDRTSESQARYQLNNDSRCSTV